ncbi:PREDICTED: uncharacterized protein LOC109237270 isoform X1 [Nicotiana attenuata]|uniref:Uncharacterized protein n=1 Tax=Nicotiana attenuata TaxID=49451 RepID=A0A314LEQ8_NICAT|nr:PREDICTED: uncharacterized protein LOC109237270 isoform X1 [Nicotiana attenuata]OIT40073.1 hypothetical protein A4A49_27146 [Nicotiana attenuata]
MAGDLFEDLPPPAAPLTSVNGSAVALTEASAPPPPPQPPLPPPALKSALKRSKPPAESQPETSAPEKRLRFKTITDASETQVIEAMQKIASHIKNIQKFSKASKLALQLIQAGSVKPATSDHFFAILEAAMSSLTTCNEPSVRADYHELFTAVQDTIECLSKKQQNMVTTWTMRAVVANDLFTDDSFVFSKATGRIKEAISNLPVATEDDDVEEAACLEETTEAVNEDAPTGNKEESDPFGLDALIPSTSKKDDKSKGKRVTLAKARKGEEEEETKRFLRSQREAMISCLEIAANRYRTPWCQTAIDILVKHAFDNISRFTSRQRDAIGKLWASVREQQVRRKQGKSVSGKLDVNAFERLQAKYATEKISIRRAVGGSGDRKCQQWLG